MGSQHISGVKPHPPTPFMALKKLSVIHFALLDAVAKGAVLVHGCISFAKLYLMKFRGVFDTDRHCTF